MRNAFLIVLVLNFPVAVLAQTVVPINASWQLSLDNGQTWQGGTVVAPASQTSVRVRQLVSWQSQSSADHFNSATFDGVIRSINGAGLNDTTSNLSGILDGTYMPLPSLIQGRRWAPDIIKIDRGDALAPGLGSFVGISNTGFTGGIIYGNPIQTFEYTLHLDGTPGERQFSAAWLLSASTGTPVLTARVTGLDQPYTFSPTFNDATLIVVPSPSGLALVGVASGVVLRRRRS